MHPRRWLVGVRVHDRTFVAQECATVASWWRAEDRAFRIVPFRVYCRMFAERELAGTRGAAQAADLFFCRRDFRQADLEARDW